MVEVVQKVLSAHGEVVTRRWGDVVSVELVENGQKTFSFQVATRDVQLSPPLPLGWVDVMSDSLDDLVASKMVALVERGAPRDFRDIRAVCSANLVQPKTCWELWRRRLIAAGSDPDMSRATLAVQTHLARISRARPVDMIENESLRTEARELRSWFAEVFLPQGAGK